MGLHRRQLHMLTYSDEEHAKTDENVGIDKNACRLCCALHEEGGFARGCSCLIRMGLKESKIMIMVIVDIFWYLMLLVGSELILVVPSVSCQMSDSFPHSLSIWDGTEVWR
jgi:hypothetical protein